MPAKGTKKQAAEWRDLAEEKKPFSTCTVAVDVDVFPLRPIQCKELVKWAKAIEYDTKWLVVSKQDCPLHFVSQEGDINTLALPAPAPPVQKVTKKAASKKKQVDPPAASSPAKKAKIVKAAKKAAPPPSPPSPAAPVAVPPPKKQNKLVSVDKIAAGMLSGAKVIDDNSCTLNQTNLGNANNNKFYICQALVSGGAYYEFSRWGRVGVDGQTKLDPQSSAADAIKAFEKKFKSKTSNNWADRENFEKKKWKYELIETENDSTVVEAPKANSVEGKAQAAKAAKAAKVPSKLDKTTAALVDWILDADMFKSAMASFQIDANKCPLGAITKKQVAKGFSVLEQLDYLLSSGKKEGKGAKLSDSDKRSEIMELSGRFYTLIPHSYGMSKPPLIDNETILKEKFSLVSVLGDIEIAQGLQSQGDIDASMNPIDKKYQQLQATLTHVKASSRDYKLVQKNIDTTKSVLSWNNKIKLLDMWEVDRKGEGERFKEHKKLDNRRLLWHGTNVAVVAAILKTGLRIMPTASSGSRVGRGIYLASENGKSAGYCRTAKAGSKNHAIMFLCEAPMGKMKVITEGDSSLTKAPAGFDSILAKGNQEPDPAFDEYIKLDGNDVLIPQAKPIPTSAKSQFHQSEYLVYKESQCRIRYMLRCEF